MVGERKSKTGAVVRAASGNFLELYDFLVYVYFASYIAKAFFPAQSEFVSLMLAFGTYGVASVARPFGAVILGSYMDRKGRRKGLLLTLALMAAGTVSLAITPSYASIGLLAPLIVTAGRLIQGFSLGVEAGGVNVYFVNGYTPTFGSSALHLAPLGNFTVTLVTSAASFVLLPVAGAISDRIGRWPMVIGSSLLVIATAYPAFSWLVAAPSFTRLLLVESWLAVLYAMYAGALVPLIAELMPAKVRSSGYAIILSLANGIFGSFTPAVATFLIHVTGNRASPALWLSAAAAISFTAAVSARRFTQSSGRYAMVRGLYSEYDNATHIQS